MMLLAPLTLATLAILALLCITLGAVQRHGQIVKEFLQGGDIERRPTQTTLETQAKIKLLEDRIPPFDDGSVRIYIGVVTRSSRPLVMY
jgi:hypothetical protein